MGISVSERNCKWDVFSQLYGTDAMYIQLRLLHNAPRSARGTEGKQPHNPSIQLTTKPQPTTQRAPARRRTGRAAQLTALRRLALI